MNLGGYFKVNGGGQQRVNFPTNKPSELTLLIPGDLPDGEYELTVTTQFAGGNNILKSPRSVSVNVHVGGGGGNGEDDRPVIE